MLPATQADIAACNAQAAASAAALTVLITGGGGSIDKAGAAAALASSKIANGNNSISGPNGGGDTAGAATGSQGQGQTTESIGLAGFSMLMAAVAIQVGVIYLFIYFLNFKAEEFLHLD